MADGKQVQEHIHKQAHDAQEHDGQGHKQGLDEHMLEWDGHRLVQ